MLIPFDTDSPQPDWSSLENTSLGDFQLHQFLGADATSAVFHAVAANNETSYSVIKFYRVEQDSLAETQTEIWQEAKRLNHPNLIRVAGAGRAALGDHKLIYVAVEPADESLASALTQRQLEPAEAVEILTSTKSALEYLHGRGFIHSCLSPGQVFAVGDAIKLSTESLRKPGPSQRLIASHPKYLAPESSEVNTSRAADVWCLGATLLEATTGQSVASGKWSAQAAPEQLRTAIQRCLIADPNLRTNLAQIDRPEIPPQPAPPPLAVQPEPTPVPQPARPEPPKTLYPLKPERPAIPFWGYAMAAVVLIAILIWLFRPSNPQKPAESAKAVPASQQKTVPPTPDTAPPAPLPAEKLSPAHPAAGEKRQVKPPQQQAPNEIAATKPETGNKESGNNVNGDVWRVVVYTYGQESDAQQRADAINSKNPDLRAAAFSPNGKSPFLVTVGGAMSRADAKRFRQNAVRLGMPYDSYTQNFTR